MDFSVLQKFLGVAKLFHMPTSRREQSADRLQDGWIIVEEADNVGVWVKQSDEAYTRRSPNEYETLVSCFAAGAMPAFATKRTSSATEVTRSFCIIRPR